MKVTSQSTGGLRLQIVARNLALGILLITAVTASAHAAGERDRGRTGAGERDWRAHEGRRHGHGYEPGVVYAPPVVYSPPAYQSPGLNLIIPLNFR